MKNIMMRNLLIFSSVLLMVIVSMLACSEDDRPKLCSTCPEIDPAYAAAEEYIYINSDMLGLREDIDGFIAYDFNEDGAGWSHIRFYQTFHGVRVIQSGLVVHVDSSYENVWHNGYVLTDIDVNHQPQITSSRGLEIAEEHFDSLGYQGGAVEAAELVVLRWSEIDHLCWRYVLSGTNTHQRIEYFVDAHNGQIVTWWSLIRYDD